MLHKKIAFLTLLLTITLMISTSASADSTWGGGVEGELPFDFPSEIDWGAGFNYLDIAVDQNDAVWIATAGVGLLRYDGVSWQHFVIINDIRITLVSDVAVDQNNNIWFTFLEVDDTKGLGDSYVAKYDGAEFTTYRFKDTGFNDSQNLRGLTVDTDNVIWFIADDVLVSFDGSQWLAHRPEFEGRISNSTITVDSMNRKWFSFYYNGSYDGLCCFDGESWSRVDFDKYAQRDGFNIQVIALDSQDNVWVNASFHTLLKYNGETTEIVLDNYECENIWSIDGRSMVFDDKDVLWSIGRKYPRTEENSCCLMSYDGSTWEKHFAPDVSFIPGGIAVDRNGTKWMLNSYNYSYFTGGHIESGNQTAVDGGEATPGALAITGVSPNPFNPETAISYVLPDGGHVTVSVYDILGREIARLDDRHMSAGAHTTRWDGRDAEGRLVSSGTYICSVKTASSVATRKMTLMK